MTAGPLGLGTEHVVSAETELALVARVRDELDADWERKVEEAFGNR
jgi:hypothetical protein